MGVRRQILCTGIACLAFLSLGLTQAWPSCTLKLFASNETVLNRPMTGTELSLLGSVASIGALISTPLAGYFLDVVGRKYCTLVSMLMSVICWTMVLMSSQVEVVLTAVFISGFGGGIIMFGPILICEICQENIRGTMTSGAMIFYNIGMLISYVAGGNLEYKTMAYLSWSLSLVGTLLVTILRETPVYLMKKGLEEEAAKSFAYYRSADVNSKVVMNEMAKLRRAFNAQLDEEKKSPEKEALALVYEEKLAIGGAQTSAEKPSLWILIRKSRSTRRALLVTLILVTAGIFQGLVVLQTYAEPLLEKVVPNLPVTVACIIFSIVSIVSGFIAAYLTDTAGRKNLMVYSSLGTCICCVVLGSQLHLRWGPQWITAIFIYLFTAVNTFGAGTVSNVLVAEVFLPEVKSFLSMCVVEWVWLCNFTILFIFIPLVEAIGLGPTFYLFAAICLATAAFSQMFQPETKGLPVDVIQTLFLKQLN